jgi:hypothetical protein
VTTAKKIQIKEFAQRVERLCDFLLAQVKDNEESGSDDLLVIKSLKEDAANLQFDQLRTFDGLDNFMKGLD